MTRSCEQQRHGPETAYPDSKGRDYRLLPQNALRQIPVNLNAMREWRSGTIQRYRQQRREATTHE